jgi:LysM repeat protein
LQIVAGAADNAPEVAPQFDPNNYFIHVVSYGETLFIIGQRYGFTVQELADYNAIVNVNQIKFNQEILIPIR